MQKLHVTDIHKRFGDTEVLKGIGLDAAAGDVISIIGSSGSGKSTFLRCRARGVARQLSGAVGLVPARQGPFPAAVGA